MKRTDLVRKLDEAGYKFFSHGGNHDLFKKGKQMITVPRHREINEITAKEILKKAGLQ